MWPQPHAASPADLTPQHNLSPAPQMPAARAVALASLRRRKSRGRAAVARPRRRCRRRPLRRPICSMCSSRHSSPRAWTRRGTARPSVSASGRQAYSRTALRSAHPGAVPVREVAPGMRETQGKPAAGCATARAEQQLVPQQPSMTGSGMWTSGRWMGGSTRGTASHALTGHVRRRSCALRQCTRHAACPMPRRRILAARLCRAGLWASGTPTTARTCSASSGRETVCPRRLVRGRPCMCRRHRWSATGCRRGVRYEGATATKARLDGGAAPCSPAAVCASAAAVPYIRGCGPMAT